MSASKKPQPEPGLWGGATRRWSGAQAALRRSLARKAGLPERAEDILSSILNISGEGIIVTDPDQRILLFSQGAEAIFGYLAREVLGRPLDILIPPEHRGTHGAHVERFAAGPVLSRRMRGQDLIFGVTKAGLSVPLEVGLSKLASPQGNIFTAIVRDISERRDAEAALARAATEANAANHAKSAFLAAMSHEIRTPLNGVLGMAQAMARDELPPRQQSRLTVIRQSGENLLAILNDLLDLSKIEAGRLELEDAEFDLADLVGGAQAIFSDLAAQKGLDLDMRVLDRARGTYRGDPLRIRQILHNLISNAIKFTEAGSVKVTAGRAGGALTFLVRDSGIGIPADRVARLFHKFEQGDASTTRRFGGTGLGLAISRDLAEMMGGGIDVASRPGKGTSFHVRLPLPRVAARRRAVDPPAPSQEASDSPSRILVAEDNPTNQLVIQALLVPLGVELRMVADGRAAVSAWEAHDWDLILMDIQMPEMDGATATSIIRMREVAEGRPRTPILALTANAMAHQLSEYREAGMDGVVAKPIEVEKLFVAIATACAAGDSST